EVIKRVTDTVYQTSTATVRPIHTQDPDVSKYVSKTYSDSIARALDIAVKNINSLSRVTVKLRDSIQGILSQDQDGIRWASMKDKTFDIRYNQTDNIFYPQVTLSLDQLDYRKRASIFHQWQYLSDFRASDPRIEFSGIHRVKS